MIEPGVEEDLITLPLDHSIVRSETSAMTGLLEKTNINTWVAICGFIATLFTIVSSWNNVKNTQDNTDRWIGQHVILHEQISRDVLSLHDIDSRRDVAMVELTSRVAQLEKGQESMEDRIDRMSQNTANQFTTINGNLSSITTQLALFGQSLQRIEGAGSVKK